MILKRLVTRVIPTLVAVFLALSVLAPTREADAQPGIRFGVTDDPEALFVGFEYAFALGDGGPGIFVLEPGVDLGVGDDGLDLFIRGTAHFKFVIPVGRGNDFVIYPLVGPDITHFEFDGPADDTEIGVDLGFGFGFKSFTFELWVGVSDIPDITAAFAFHF